MSRTQEQIAVNSDTPLTDAAFTHRSGESHWEFMKRQRATFAAMERVIAAFEDSLGNRRERDWFKDGVDNPLTACLLDSVKIRKALNASTALHAASFGEVGL